MNKIKTKVMFNTKVQSKEIIIDGESLEEAEEYNYLGQMVKVTKDYANEKRRITLGWKVFGKYNKTQKGSLPLCLKHIVSNQFILPAIVYGCET